MDKHGLEESHRTLIGRYMNDQDDPPEPEQPQQEAVPEPEALAEPEPAASALHRYMTEFAEAPEPESELALPEQRPEEVDQVLGPVTPEPQVPIDPVPAPVGPRAVPPASGYEGKDLSLDASRVMLEQVVRLCEQVGWAREEGGRHREGLAAG